jgi:hypothetical protein
LQVTGYRLRVTGCGLKVSGCGCRVTGCGLGKGDAQEEMRVDPVDVAGGRSFWQRGGDEIQDQGGIAAEGEHLPGDGVGKVGG